MTVCVGHQLLNLNSVFTILFLFIIAHIQVRYPGYNVYDNCNQILFVFERKISSYVFPFPFFNLCKRRRLTIYWPCKTCFKHCLKQVCCSTVLIRSKSKYLHWPHGEKGGNKWLNTYSLLNYLHAIWMAADKILKLIPVINDRPRCRMWDLWMELWHKHALCLVPTMICAVWKLRRGFSCPGALQDAHTDRPVFSRNTSSGYSRHLTCTDVWRGCSTRRLFFYQNKVQGFSRKKIQEKEKNRGV